MTKTVRLFSRFRATKYLKRNAQHRKAQTEAARATDLIKTIGLTFVCLTVP